ncbi:hypothetical protein ElyMa_005807300 [Elysia marginata]|uniref:DhaK domain-containing protein n=1 Tax=Elysia marginata TaxID=1093978 RepID=A0AAV4FWM7_9GAST|nr:hypothetical protein ElyMa_005807300 [Elysia marginata]
MDGGVSRIGVIIGFCVLSIAEELGKTEAAAKLVDIPTKLFVINGVGCGAETKIFYDELGLCKGERVRGEVDDRHSVGPLHSLLL